MKSESQSLHDQLVDLLREQIRTRMAPNTKLPAERTLALQYHVSRNTVRAALALLENDGVIYRSRGRGTFVANPEAEPTDLAMGYSFSTQMAELGRKPASQVLYLQEFPADAYIVKHLHVPLGTPTYKLKRLRCADGVPLMVERTFLPADRFPKMSAEEVEQNGLYHVLETRYACPVGDATEAFFASLITATDARLLKVPNGSPSLSVQRTTRGTNGEVIEFTLSIARADQFVYRYHHNPKKSIT